MPIKHTLLALLVVIAWGLNFIFVQLSLTEFSPLFLCALRFLLASVPAIFFIKPPAASFKMVVLYGLVMFALQFSLLFMGMHMGVTSGMASLIMQVQVFFSMIFSALLLSERPNAWQIAGALVSFTGIALVATHLDQNLTLIGFIFILLAAATWGIGNLIAKKLPRVSMMSLIVWGCFVASIPLFLLSLIIEGPSSMINSYHHMTWVGVSGLFYTVCISTWVGYGAWNSLIRRYPIGTIVPFTLLIPIVGIIGSILILGEPFQSWKLVSGLLVISGLYINLLSARFVKINIQQKAC